MISLARWDRVAAGLVGSAIFLWIIGTYPLDPTHIDWMAGDNAQHLLGWAFFRHEAWHLPLGRITHFPIASGTSLVFTDSLPLFGLPFRAIAGLLPEPFQYHGWWLLTCFVLQGACGAALLDAYGVRSPWARVCGAPLFVVAPWFNTHISIMGQWQLLIALALYAIDAREGTARAWRWSALCAVALLTHFYLWWMIATIAAASFARDAWQRRSLKPFLRHAGILLGTSALTMACLGYFSGEDPASGGFGLYSTNLNAIINSNGWSRWIPGLPRGPYQYEGPAYFGVAGLVLLAVALAVHWRSDKTQRAQWLPLWIALGYLYLLAVSTTVMWGDHVILQLPPGRGAFFGTIRAAGRFVVIVADALLLFALVTWAKRFPRAAAPVFALATLTQLYELTPLNASRHIGPGEELSALHDPAWSAIAPDYAHLAIYPPLLSPMRCIAPEDASDMGRLRVSTLALFAAAHDLTLNSAYLARRDKVAQERYCKAFIAQVDRGEIEPRTAYVVDEKFRERFHAHMAVDCAVVDGLELCTAKADTTALHEAIVRHK